VARIQHLFSIRLLDQAVVWSQNPLLLVRHQSEPEPDVMLLAPRADFYSGGLPEPPDVRLLVEVAESSLQYDRRTKFPLYARSGVAVAAQGRLSATSSAGMFAPPTGTTMYCRPRAM